jgi:hypothetical protein
VNSRPSTRLAVETAVALGALAAGAVLFALNRHVRSDSIFSLRALLEDLGPAVAFFSTGLVLRARRPGNLVGVLSFTIGLLGLVSWMLTQYAGYGLVTHPGSLPGVRAIEIGLQGAWGVEVAFLVVLICVFPDGRLLPGRWRIIPWAGVAAFGTLWLVGMTTLPPAPFQHVHDPLHPSGHSPLLLPIVVAIPLGIASVIGAVATVVARFRRASADEREQLKWLILAASILPAGLIAHSIADTFAPGADGTIELFFSLGVIAFPVAIGIAVLKYRLYDIDRIISRTLVYGVLTVVLGGMYVGLVLASEAVFASVARGSSVAVALSTLIVAGLFLPVRRGVQRFVDRRFYRSKIDAEMTLARFGARLQREADLDTLLSDVRSVVTEALAPAHVSLWIRSDAGFTRNDPETATR